MGVPPLRGVGSPSGLGPSASLSDRPMPYGWVGQQCALAHPSVAPNAAAQFWCVERFLIRQSNACCYKITLWFATKLLYLTIFLILFFPFNKPYNADTDPVKPQ
jgi:hypothetical protein